MAWKDTPLLHIAMLSCSDVIICYLRGRPAGLLQGVDQLLLDGHGDLLIPPATGIVLADIEPDQAPAIDIVPTHIPIVRGAVACVMRSVS